MKLKDLPVKELPQINGKKIIAQTGLFTVEKMNITFSNNELFAILVGTAIHRIFY